MNAQSRTRDAPIPPCAFGVQRTTGRCVVCACCRFQFHDVFEDHVEITALVMHSGGMLGLGHKSLGQAKFCLKDLKATSRAAHSAHGSQCIQCTVHHSNRCTVCVLQAKSLIDYDENFVLEEQYDDDAAVKSVDVVQGSLKLRITYRRGERTAQRCPIPRAFRAPRSDHRSRSLSLSLSLCARVLQVDPRH